MKLRNFLPLLIAVLLVSFRANSQEKPKATANGVEYKIYTANTGEKIKLNDIITFNFIQKTDRDSVLFSSYQAGRPVKIQVQPSRSITDLMDFFTLLAPKDSAWVKIPADSVFKNNEAQRPPYLPKGSGLVFLIKIEKVQSLDEVIAEERQEMERLQSEEKVAMNKYLADNHLTPKVTNSGLRYVVTKTSTKNKPESGDTVEVNYTGRTLEGKVFDSSIEEEATRAGLEQPGRKYEPISFVVGKGNVIRGWDEGLLLLNEGSKAKLIIPSDLAYGPQGAGEDIKPFSTLIFDVELVKVKPAKKTSTTSKPAGTKAAPAKKPAAVKKTPAPTKKPVPAKKPVSTQKH